jgi:acyl carrier protein
VTEERAAPSRDEVLATLQQAAVAVLGDEAPEITHESRLGDDENGIGIDSLDLIEIVMEVEERLDLSFESEEYEGIESIEQLIDVILAKVASAAV